MAVYLIGVFVAGAWFGAVGGAWLWNEIVTEGVRDAYLEHVERTESRLMAWKRMALYAEGEKAALAREFGDNERWSRKTPNLRSVS